MTSRYTFKNTFTFRDARKVIEKITCVMGRNNTDENEERSGQDAAEENV